MVVSSDPYRIARPTGARVPILLSVPHCGVAFPEEVREEFQPGLINAPDDTDWFVDRLYGFASSMGITMISAVYSRWVIDLNRHPEGKPLYSDGRIVTALCPVTTFRQGAQRVIQQFPHFLCPDRMIAFLFIIHIVDFCHLELQCIDTARWIAVMPCDIASLKRMIVTGLVWAPL